MHPETPSTVAQVTPLAIFLRLAVAALLGACIGFERQWRQRSAGLHTIGLVAVGAALFTLLDLIIGSGDQTRITAGIVAGVGFIAGGVILRTGLNVTGLNTAATIWATAAVGALAGFGLWPEAFAGTLAIILLNLLFQPIADWIDVRARNRQRNETIYTVVVVCSLQSRSAVSAAIVEVVSNSPLSLQSLKVSYVDDDSVKLSAEILSPKVDDERIQGLSARLLAIGGVQSAQWQNSS